MLIRKPIGFRKSNWNPKRVYPNAMEEVLVVLHQVQKFEAGGLLRSNLIETQFKIVGAVREIGETHVTVNMLCEYTSLLGTLEAIELSIYSTHNGLQP